MHISVFYFILVHTPVIEEKYLLFKYIWASDKMTVGGQRKKIIMETLSLCKWVNLKTSVWLKRIYRH